METVFWRITKGSLFGVCGSSLRCRPHRNIAGLQRSADTPQLRSLPFCVTRSPPHHISQGLDARLRRSPIKTHGDSPGSRCFPGKVRLRLLPRGTRHGPRSMHPVGGFAVAALSPPISLLDRDRRTACWLHQRCASDGSEVRRKPTWRFSHRASYRCSRFIHRYQSHKYPTM